jgi:hypothetical protein
MSGRGGFFGWLWRLYVWIDYGRYYDEKGKDRGR